MAKYKKRKDGRYMTHVDIGHDENGNRKRKTFTDTTIRGLEAQVAEFKTLRNKGVLVVDSKITLAEWAIKWFTAYRNYGAMNTIKLYDRCINSYIIPSELADIPLLKIKPINLRNLVNVAIEEGHIRTAQILVQTLKMIFDQAVDDDLIYKSPARGLKKPAYKIPEKRALTDIENKAIDNAGLTLKERAFVYIGKYAGLRRGEILALTRNDFDFKKSTVTVNKQVVFDENVGVVEPFPKTDAGNRTVPMPDILRTHIALYAASIESLSLFLTRDGNVCSLISYRRMWASIVHKLNVAAGSKGDFMLITDLTAHILRHDYATSLYYAGVDIKTAQVYLGHKDIRTTLSIYTHLEKKTPKQAEKINSYYGRQMVDNDQFDADAESSRNEKSPI